MKEIRTEDAVGHILCHDITQIIKDVKKGCFLRKDTLSGKRIFLFYFLWEKNTYMSGRRRKESFTRTKVQRFFIRSVPEIQIQCMDLISKKERLS